MTPPKISIGQRLMALGIAAAVPVGGAVLYRHPPAETGLYPHCIFHQLTGLHCPGCGATRCLYALLHGDLHQAAAYNLLFLCLLPALLIWAALTWWSLFTGRPLPAVRPPQWSVWVLLGVLVAFGVLRNLGFPPFSLLAPHELGPG